MKYLQNSSIKKKKRRKKIDRIIKKMWEKIKSFSLDFFHLNLNKYKYNYLISHFLR